MAHITSARASSIGEFGHGDRDLSQERLAQDSGVDRTTVSKIERKLLSPTLSSVPRWIGSRAALMKIVALRVLGAHGRLERLEVLGA